VGQFRSPVDRVFSDYRLLTSSSLNDYHKIKPRGSYHLLNSSSIQETNPPSEARAESLDSFSPQPAIGQPRGGDLASDSPEPVSGLSRRTALVGLAVLPAVGLPAVPAAEHDPIFALIAAKRAADIAHGEGIDAQDKAGYDSSAEARGVG
jgi:hypothetical protein